MSPWDSAKEAIVDCALAVGIMAAILGLLLGGCATSTPLPASRIDGEAVAVSIAWRIYGRTDTPPLVRWRQGDQLDCTDPNSGKAGFSIPDPDEGTVCREGLTMSFLECWVAWHGEASFADTALAHELAHVALSRRWIFDTRHTRNEWWGDGGLVDIANGAIREAGR